MCAITIVLTRHLLWSYISFQCSVRIRFGCVGMLSLITAPNTRGHCLHPASHSQIYDHNPSKNNFKFVQVKADASLNFEAKAGLKGSQQGSQQSCKKVSKIPQATLIHKSG